MKSNDGKEIIALHCVACGREFPVPVRRSHECYCTKECREKDRLVLRPSPDPQDNGFIRLASAILNGIGREYISHLQKEDKLTTERDFEEWAATLKDLRQHLRSGYVNALTMGAVTPDALIYGLEKAAKSGEYERFKLFSYEQNNEILLNDYDEDGGDDEEA